MEVKQKMWMNSPIGIIELEGSDKGLSSLIFVEDAKISPHTPPLLKEVHKQLKEYFDGKRKEFSLELDLQGTEFQLKVWNKLLEIPYGKTISYLQLAKNLGDPKSIRAAGTANGRNSVSIIVPCHRVIGSDGKLIGYGGGLWRKDWLLKHENNWFKNDLFSQDL
jgi:methylated-DNA-[protein]-cysteine S-methyltransferase